MGCAQSLEVDKIGVGGIGVVQMTYTAAPSGLVLKASPLSSDSKLPQGLGPKCKVVHLVRHGQATHNLIAEQSEQSGGAADTNVFVNPALRDAALTEKGRRDARNAGAALRTYGPDKLPQVAITSPLTRAAETAAIALYAGNLGSISCIADEWCRERMGVHHCDARSELKHLSGRFPTVDFGGIAAGADPYHSDTVRESESELVSRGRAFLWSLAARPETVIAVFTHSSFLRNTLRHGVEVTDEGLRERFANGELRSIVLTYETESE